MKVAITCAGNTVNDLVDPRFGRCETFAIYDTESKNTTFVENTAKSASGGAGPAAVQIIAKQGVEKAVSHEFGFKIKALMDSLNIQMIAIEGDKTINDIIKLLENK